MLLSSSPTTIHKSNKQPEKFGKQYNQLDITWETTWHNVQISSSSISQIKHGRIPIFVPRSWTRANTKRVFVFVFRNEDLFHKYLFAFVLPNPNKHKQGNTRIKNYWVSIMNISQLKFRQIFYFYRYNSPN